MRMTPEEARSELLRDQRRSRGTVLVEMASRRLDQALDVLAKEEAFGLADEWEEGAVIRFDKAFRPGGRKYTYTALLCPNNQWYTSGPNSPGPYTWERLVEFLSEGVDEVWCVTSYERVYPL